MNNESEKASGKVYVWHTNEDYGGGPIKKIGEFC